MRYPGKTMSLLLVLSTTLLFLSPAYFVSANTVSVYYKEVLEFELKFPNGKEIDSREELIIIISSQRYDVARSGIMFYERDANGNADMTSSVTPDHTSTYDGNTVTYRFSNLTSDIEIHFSDLKEMDLLPESKNELNIDNSQISTIIVTALSVMFATIMLIAMIIIMRKFDLFYKDRGEI